MRAIYRTNATGQDYYCTSEILAIGYDDDITGIQDENGEYDKYKNTLYSGLYIVLEETGEYIYFESVSRERSIELCRQALETGFVDLTPYGLFKELCDFEENGEYDTSAASTEVGSSYFHQSVGDILVSGLFILGSVACIWGLISNLL